MLKKIVEAEPVVYRRVFPMANSPPPPRTRRRPARAAPAYFVSLSVGNLRCFGPEQTLDLSDGSGNPARWVVLLGESGAGKTTVLQCLASLMGASGETNSGNGISRPLDTNSAEPRPPQRGRGSPRLSGEVRIGRPLTAPSGKSTVKRIVIDDGARTPGARTDAFPCFGYGAARRIGPLSPAAWGINDPVATLFSDDATLAAPEGRLLQADYAVRMAPAREAASADAGNGAAARLAQLRDLVLGLLPDLQELRFAVPAGGPQPPFVEARTPYGWVPMGDLSLADRTVLAWTVDLAIRLFARYPESANPLAEPAVALVDEIDLHLHPRFQRELAGRLEERFPNVQFVVTTYSPLMVQGAPGARIAVLRREGDYAVIDNRSDDTGNWRADQLLTSDLFGLESARPPEVEKLLAARTGLLSKGRLTAADERRLRDLEARIGDLPVASTPHDMEAMDIIRQAAARLKRPDKG